MTATADDLERVAMADLGESLLREKLMGAVDARLRSLLRERGQVDDRPGDYQPTEGLESAVIEPEVALWALEDALSGLDGVSDRRTFLAWCMGTSLIFLCWDAGRIYVALSEYWLREPLDESLAFSRELLGHCLRGLRIEVEVRARIAGERGIP